MTFRLTLETSVALINGKFQHHTYTVGQTYAQTLATLPVRHRTLFPEVNRFQWGVLVLPRNLFAQTVWQTHVSCNAVFFVAFRRVRTIYRATHGVQRIIEDSSAWRMVRIGLQIAIRVTAVCPCSSAK